MYDLLDELGIVHLRQHLIAGKFCVDAFVPTANAVLQMDGDYWHGNPRFYPHPDARQCRRMNQDRSQDAYMVACGYRIVRIWASELKANPTTVRLLLASLLAAPGTPELPQNGRDPSRSQ